MVRSILLTAAVLLVSCTHVRSNLPNKMTRQIRRDYRCNDMQGSLVQNDGQWETWDVVACGQPLRISCPFGAHSRWRRCRYDQPTAGGAAPVMVVDSTGAVPPPASDADSQVRAQIDQRAGAILQCTGNAPATIDLTWDANAAAATVSLASAPGTPADDCVRSNLGALAFPAGTTGAIRHVVSPPPAPPPGAAPPP